MKYQYIAIEGNIGAGKTTLAHRLSKELGASIILEQFSDNIFLEKFYANPSKYAFQLETGLMVDRFDQLKHDLSSGLGPFVSDYYFGKATVFAKINLPAEQFALFLNLYENLVVQLPEPDIIIYLHNSVPSLRKNIRKRGRIYEQNIEESYLEKISRGYDELFQRVNYTSIITVNLDDIDFVRNNFAYTAIKKIFETQWQPGVNQFIINPA